MMDNRLADAGGDDLPDGDVSVRAADGRTVTDRHGWPPGIGVR
jgi:hypothetical protein